MKPTTWFEVISTCKTIDDIKIALEKHRRTFRKWFIVSICMVSSGAGIMSSTSNTKTMMFGLLIAIAGILNTVLMKLWAHTKLSMFQILYEMKKDKEDQAG
jgi:hypothetical protein